MKKQILSRFFNLCPHSGRIKSVKAGLFFPLAGLAGLIWLLVRVIPKPSRATYPCMKVAFPLAATFIAWIAAMASSVFIFHQAQARLKQSRWLVGGVLLVLGAAVGLSALLTPQKKAGAAIVYTQDPFGPTNPIGVPKGINPGRVVWVHNPDATNENCIPDQWGDGYFLDKNCNQAVVDEMLSTALLKLTDAESEESAWDQVFRYFNRNHDKGDVGYSAGETIFIKINAVHAWTTKSDGSIKNDGNYGNVDSSPQAVLAMLRQLVNKAGVPQENIYIGDPYTHIFNHNLEKWRADFPNIHYMDKSGRDGREKYTASTQYSMFFSDRGSVISEKKDKYFTVMENADYLLDIPAMKGHRWGGVTLFGKNFFGANTRSGAGHMHPALHRQNYDEPLRGEYGMYRVFVDLLGHKNLGGKILIYYMDALWSCSYEHEPPVKFKMAPFNNDWTSSILLSQDPLAIESVCLDILQAEFPKTESEKPGNYWYANFPACDDYLHQAADSSNWPEGIVYDPENDGTPISSLGVHEHWNNAVDKQYSFDLGGPKGVELVKLSPMTDVKNVANKPLTMVLLQNYPNPFNVSTTIEYELADRADVRLCIYDLTGRQIDSYDLGPQDSGKHSHVWNGDTKTTGAYFYQINTINESGRQTLTRRMMLIK